MVCIYGNVHVLGNRHKHRQRDREWKLVSAF